MGRSGGMELRGIHFRHLTWSRRRHGYSPTYVRCRLEGNMETGDGIPGGEQEEMVVLYQGHGTPLTGVVPTSAALLIVRKRRGEFLRLVAPTSDGVGRVVAEGPMLELMATDPSGYAAVIRGERPGPDPDRPSVPARGHASRGPSRTGPRRCADQSRQPQEGLLGRGPGTGRFPAE